MDGQTHKAIGAIYDAAVAPGRWRHALDAVAQIGGAHAMALVIRNDPTGGRDRTLLSSPYLEFSKTLKGIYYGTVLDRHQAADWDRLSRYAPMKAVPDTEGGRAVAELDARPDYRSLRRNLGVNRRMGIKLSEDRVWFDAASLGYEQAAPVAQHALGRAQDLLPHLGRAVEISRMFFKLRQAHRAALAALDHVDLAILICRGDGQIMAANARAERMMGDAEGLFARRDNQLGLSDHAAHAALLAAIRDADGAEGAVRPAIYVARSGDQAPLIIEVSPLRDSAAELEPGLSGALVSVIDPDRMPQMNIDRFATCYELTKAEAEVCKLLIGGASEAQIGEQRETSPTTAKNQINAVLGKTGCGTRADLMRLVLRVLPPVR